MKKTSYSRVIAKDPNTPLEVLERLMESNDFEIIEPLIYNKNSSAKLLDTILFGYSSEDSIIDIYKHPNLSSDSLSSLLASLTWPQDNHNKTFKKHLNILIIEEIINNKFLYKNHIPKLLNIFIEFLNESIVFLNEYKKSLYLSVFYNKIHEELNLNYSNYNVMSIKNLLLNKASKLIDYIKTMPYFCPICKKGFIENSQELMVHIDLEQEKGHVFTNAYLLLIRNENLF